MLLTAFAPNALESAAIPERDELADAERDFGNEVLAESVAQAGEDFPPAVADDFAKPGAAVHCNEQGALAQTGGLGMSRDVRLKQVVPDFDNFRLSAAAVDADIGQDTREDVTC